MININNSQIDTIATKHYTNCFNDVSNRLLLIKDVFNALGKKKYISLNTNESISLRYNLSESTIKTLINPILIEKHKKVGKKYKIDIKEIASILLNGSNTCVRSDRYFYIEGFDIFEKIHNDLENILKGKPTYLYDKYVDDLGVINKSKQLKFKYFIEKIFQYENLTSETGFVNNRLPNWNSYSLTNELKINVCPYCNKNWINTVMNKNGKITNPQLDHYFSKSEYPLLRLSFYNLIPSCETCNSRIKKAKELIYKENTHPYETGFDPKGKIISTAFNSASAQGQGTHYSVDLEFEKNISIDLKLKIQNTFDFFCIKDIYEKHGDIIREIFFKHQKYGFTYLSELLSDEKFKGMEIRDLYQFIYGNYFEVEDYSKRPFAKLTRDTIESLGII